MKKFVLVLLALIAVLAIILYFKMNGNISANSSIPTSETPISSFSNTSSSSDFSSPSSSSGYSSEDIERLILQGQETLNSADSVYYERHVKGMLFKHYYKGNKEKYESYYKTSEEETKIITEIKNLEDNTNLSFYHATKTKTITQVGKSGISLQKFLITYIENKDYFRSEFVYIKDEKLEEKDCIFMKVLCYDIQGNEIDTDSKGLIDVYWIEKFTGFVVGYGKMQPNANASTPTTIIRNLSFGTVKDNDFSEPTL